MHNRLGAKRPAACSSPIGSLGACSPRKFGDFRYYQMLSEAVWGLKFESVIPV